MKLYKFKSLQNIDHVLDILEHKRFYASVFTDLNDPMEGSFYVEPHMGYILSNIRDEKKKMNICSFSTDFSNPLLWTHYADNFRGICFEVDIDERRCGFEYSPVEYVEEIPLLTANPLGEQEYPKLAKKVLSCKISNWKYEEEVRFFTGGRFLDRGITIKSLFLGLRISTNLRWLFRKISFDEIDVFSTQISGKRIIKKDLLGQPSDSFLRFVGSKKREN